MSKASEELKKNGLNWFAKSVKYIDAGDAIEVVTPLVSAFGDNIYCWVEQVDGIWRVSDDGNLLFKLDPGQYNGQLYADVADIAVGAGFEFDEETCEIFCELQEVEELPQAISDLAQLQVSLTYLAN